MLNKVFQKRLSMLKKSMRLKSEVTVQMNSQQPALYETTQFSKSRLVDFGELPVGEIPIELKSSPESNHTVLTNNAKVVTEVYPVEHANVSIFMKAGSRYEKVETSGSARMLCNLFLRGSSQKNRTEMEKALTQLGANIEVTCEREMIGVTLTVNKDDVSTAINLLGEMVFDTDITQQSIDVEKDNVRDMAREVSRDQHLFTIEGLFYTSFRDHMVGQPVYGNRDTAHDLTAEIIQDHKDKTFCGDNVVFVASGNVNHEQVVSGASKWLDKLPQQPKTLDDSIHYTPHLTPTMMSQTDHEMHNLNVGISFLAPGYNNTDHVAMKFFEEVIGDYDASHDGMANVNSPERQYNSLHKHFGQLPGVNAQKTKFYSFGDFGLFTSWVHGNEIFGRRMLYLFPYICGWYAKHLNQAETFRARAKIFNKLLEQKSTPKLNLQIAENSLNFGRRVGRTEMAYRFSNISEHQHLRQVARKWFFDQDVCAHTFGNTHRISGFDHYHRGLTVASRADFNAVM